MHKWKQWVATAAATALLFGGQASVLAADVSGAQTPGSQSVDHQDGHHPHEGKKEGKRHLTPEQKEALKKAGIDPKAMKETQKEIRASLHDIRDSGHALHELLRNTKDDKLKEQVKADLKGFHDNMTQARELHMENRNLHDEFISAVDSSDTAKIKDIYKKIQANQQKELKYVQAAQKELQAELKKVQGQVKS